MSLPTGISPLHGSHATVPIACDALNAQTMAVREYHYQTEQVMAKKEDKFFSWTLTVVRSLSLDKVMAYRLQRLADCLTYLTALFSCQRTLERRKSPDVYKRQIAWDKNHNVRVVMLVSIEKNNPKAFQFWYYMSTFVRNEELLQNFFKKPSFLRFTEILKISLEKDFD